MIDYNKCVVIGCGSVGAATAYTLINNSMFSTLVLIDKDNDLAEGNAMDLNHAACFGKPIQVIAGDYSDANDASLIVITAGKNQHPGQSRQDLLKDNLKILSSIIKEIDFSLFEGIILIASNPVDSLTFAAQEMIDIPPWRIIGTGTLLDCSRLKYELGQRLNVSPENIETLVIGEHGDSEVVIRSRASIGGVRPKDFCGLGGFCYTEEEIAEIVEKTRTSAETIIEKKGSTCYGIAMSIYRIIRAIVRNEHAVLTVTARLDGDLGLYDVALGVPCVIGWTGIEAIVPIELNYSEKESLQESASTLREIISKWNLRR